MIPLIQKSIFIFILAVNINHLQCQENQGGENLNNCSPFCLKCLSETECQVCDENQFYFLNSQKKCVLIDHCNKVNQQNQCLECKNPYYPNQTKTECIEGQNIQNCLIKLTDTICSQCEQNYSINGNQCLLEQQQIPNCLYFGSSGVCQQCEQGFILGFDNTCKPIIENCRLHHQLTCKKCIEGFYLSETIQFDYLKILRDGIYQILYYENCLPLQTVENCFQYNNQGKCEICDEKHYLENNQCIFQQPIKYNVQFIENCFRYLKKNKCYQCNFNYQLSMDRTQCLPIQLQEGCLSYSSKDFINNCNQCSFSYYKNQNNQCQPRQFASISNCQKYSSNEDNCEICNEGFELLENQTQCIAINCQQYQNGSCIKCKDLYYLDQDQCQQGTIENCIRYQNDSNTCILCNFKERYGLENNSCVLKGEEIVNCLEYDENFQCQECNQNSLPLFIEDTCQDLQGRRLQGLLNCEEPLVQNFDQTECVQQRFSNCDNYDEFECFSCIEGYSLYQKICVEIFSHFKSNCEQSSEDSFSLYLDYIVETLAFGDQSQYLNVHNESNYPINDDLIALKFEDYLNQKPQWTEINKTLQNFNIKRDNFTNRKFLKNQNYCQKCSANSFPAFSRGFCAPENYVQKQEYNTQGCQVYFEKNCIQCKASYYLSFQYELIDEFKIQLQENNTKTEDNITKNGNKEKENKYGYMHKTLCVQTCNNVAQKALINTPIYGKYLQFLNSGSFFRFNSNSVFTPSRAEIVLVKDVCLDEFDKQADLDQEKDTNKWEGCTQVSSSVLAINHVSKPYRSQKTSSEQFSIFKFGKGSQKNSYNFCSKCAQNYVKVFDLNYKDYKKSVVLDLDSVPTSEANPFVKFTLGHHCINKQDQKIFQLVENCDIYTIESFPTIQSQAFHYQNRKTVQPEDNSKIFNTSFNQEIQDVFKFDYKLLNEMNRNFIENSEFEKRIVCVKCKFGYRDQLTPQQNFSIPFPEQCSSLVFSEQVKDALQNYFDQAYGEIPYWLFEGFQTKQEFQEAIYQQYLFLSQINPNPYPCFQLPDEQSILGCLEDSIKNSYTIDYIISFNQALETINECSHCKNYFKLHRKQENINIPLLNIQQNLIDNIDLQIEIQNCYAPKRYFENCLEQIPFCDLSKQLEPGIDPKSYFFSCHYCLPQNGVEYAPVMNIKGMNLVLNVSKFQEEVFTNHKYAQDPEYSKRKGFEVLNQPYLYLFPLNDLIDLNQNTPDHFISCWPIVNLPVGQSKTLEQSQQDQTIYIHQGDNIADMNYRLFTFEKLYNNNQQLQVATKFIKEDPGQLYKGVYCKQSSFYFTFDFDTLQNTDFNLLSNGDQDINKLVFTQLMQGILENPNFSCTNNLTPPEIKRECSSFKENADGICIDQDVNFGVQITQHYDQLRNHLGNFPLLFTDEQLQSNYDLQNQNSKFETYSDFTKELFQSSSRNFAASMYLMGYDSGNLETAYHQLPFFESTGFNDIFNYAFFNIKNGIENCAIQGFLRESIDDYSPEIQFSIQQKNNQLQGQFDPFGTNSEICLNQFQYSDNLEKKCFYYAQSQNYQNFYDLYDLKKNKLNSIGCIRCKNGYELVDNNQACQKVQLPKCLKSNNAFQNSASLPFYILDNIFMISFFGMDEGLGCSQCENNYISLNDNEIQFYQNDISNQNYISQKINYKSQQFTNKNQMCVELENQINLIENCTKYGIDLTKEFQNQIYNCQECSSQLHLSVDNLSCLQLPDNCLSADLVNDTVVCLQCQDNFIQNPVAQECQQKIENCLQHEFDDQNKLICQLCQNGKENSTSCENIQYCLTFDQNNMCSQCENGYQNFQTSCVEIPQNCQNVDIQGMCQSCVSDQYYLIDNQCILLPENCKQLDSQFKCIQCKPLFTIKKIQGQDPICIKIELPSSLQNCNNYEQLDQSNILTCSSCVNSFQQINLLDNPLKICHIELIENCANYQSINNFNQLFSCQRCEDNKILSNNECVIDRNIVENCLIYEVSQDKCQQCEDGYQLVLKDGNQFEECILISQIKNCEIYSQYQEFCDKCYEGFTLSQQKDFCLDDNCLNYDQTQCTQCDENTSFLSQGECFNKINNCQTYSQDFKCQTCQNGYYLSSDFLNCYESTQINFCELYSQIENKCELCLEDYFLSDDQLECIVVQEEVSYEWLPNCLLYASKNHCKICQKEFYLSESNDCQLTSSSIENCSQYKQDSQCLQCEETFDLYQENCIQPDENNCLEYQSNYYNNYQCKQCSNSYVLSFDGKCLSKNDYVNQNQEFIFSIYLDQNISIDDFISNLTVYEQEILENQNCAVFNQNQICVQCNVGYYLDLQNKCINLQQQTNCEVLQEKNLECLGCEPNYVKNAENQCIQDTQYQECFFYYQNKCEMCEQGVYQFSCSLDLTQVSFQLSYQIFFNQQKQMKFIFLDFKVQTSLQIIQQEKQNE